jgi:hypothetical protein
MTGGRKDGKAEKKKKERGKRRKNGRITTGGRTDE